MADDTEFGHVVDLTLGEPSGTELVADAAAGATTLTVDYAGDFDDAGDLMLNGVVLAYTSIAYGTTETDPDVITLAAPLGSAATTDDKVGRMAGGEPVLDWLLHVSQGDGHPADIPIPFEQRAMWSKADTSTPIPVFVSADLERLVEVPGRNPAFDQAAIDTPFITLYQPSNEPWPTGDASGALHAISTWEIATESPGLFSYNAGTGRLTFLEGGLYLFTLAIGWAGNSSGRRIIQLDSILDGVTTAVRLISGSPPDASQFFQQIVVIYEVTAGEDFRVDAWQTTGANLDLQGSSDGRRTQWQAVRVQA